MPELPEIETTLRGIKPYIEQQTVQRVVIRDYRLRWPIPRNIMNKMQQQKMQRVTRRAKYLLLIFDHGTAIIHLGMSGSLRILTTKVAPPKHAHFDIEFANDITLRFMDPRRFGALLWGNTAVHLHPLLKHLGPEPLNATFNHHYLFQTAQRRKVAIKTFIMNQKIVVGVGNIYANEALFTAGIHPLTPAHTLSLEQHHQLVKAIKRILRKAIQRGGTTLKDFSNSDGKPGYFSQHLQVYGREGLPCYQCQTPLTAVRISQRSTVFCAQCQTDSSLA